MVLVNEGFLLKVEGQKVKLVTKNGKKGCEVAAVIKNYLE